MLCCSAFSSEIQLQKKCPKTLTELVKQLNDCSVLLLEDKPFNFPELLPELQIRIVALTTPHSIGYLSRTCKYLHEKVSFQTPHIWKIVTYSLDAISDKKMPELYLKALLSENSCTQEQKPFFAQIKKEISSCYNIKDEKNYSFSDGFFLTQRTLSSDEPLLMACYSGDKNIVINTINNVNSI